jgi:protein-L-isoaspartate(D-aspartate) O-methyltransferase
MDPAVLRDDMVDRLVHESKGGVDSERLTVAMRTVTREDFLPEDRDAYADRDFEFLGTRGLAPSTGARLIELLEPSRGDDVLVVGAGVGYSVAMLAEIAGARHVHAIDIDREAVSLARSNLSAAGYDAVLVDRRDGANGLPEYAPYDRILMETAVLEPPRALREQLADGGRLVYPRGNAVQTVAAVEPAPDGTTESDDDAPPGFRTVETAGPARLRPMLVDGEQRGVERNRTRREDAERAEQGHFARHGWEQDWIDWDDRL